MSDYAKVGANISADFFAGKYPRGWFGVLFSDEIGVGEIKSLSYFGQELVAFRGENGQVSILDAFCPHLGAHLGGGKCEGNTISCPFHQWRFAQSGECIEIPYSKRIPIKAKQGALKSHHVREINQIIHLWYDPLESDPDWEVPIDPAMSGEVGWTKWYFKRWRVRTQGKEIIENLVDAPHFTYVHGSPIEDIEVKFDGRIASQRSTIGGHPTLGKKLQTEAIYFGPAVQHVTMEGDYMSKQVNIHTPIDPNHLDVCYGIKIQRDPALHDTDAIAKEYAKFAHDAFDQDVVIWNKKIYRPTPLLCEDDGPLIQLRQWYRQFFSTAL
ncbi:Rieske 2Fe-2S domain-containing protein [Comamonas testosteroni]|jgi:3-ketosteroid 9alpha-monooxygenase subunit A|uniref:Rieske 2Fe-2S domain-containing protein n=1 Tax=Comamonas testosteroni TaxID=285 RepID=UPI0026EEE668|nr:Rieske 2Fe-2S domain-containing protein [Comamonas testosteroni]WQD45348.1 Rieske 2Fe-2S domain-containing protein [Comamonas testosteroni]